MITLSAKSKKGKYYIDMYNKAKAGCLSGFYKKYSSKKYRAELQIIDEMRCYNTKISTQARKRYAHGYRILLGNCFHFTAGYIIEQDGVIIKWIIHTARHKYVIM